ncbi:MAG: anti-sigma factor, partial [Winogradskyella sp.]|nr:anti-sigma factor [Winogradskyella sp.]
MKREELILKWLDHNLNDEELKAFEALEDHKDLLRLSQASAAFKPSHYNIDKQYTLLKEKRESKTKSIGLKPLLRVAAVVVLALSLYFYTTRLDTKVITEIAQQTSVLLPDNSAVELNA